MIETPQIASVPGQDIALIRLTIPRAEMRNAMEPGIREVMAAVRTQGIGPAGPWFTHHLRMDPAIFDFEICVPVTAPVIATGRVTGSRTPQFDHVARTVYRGGYEGLANAWAEFDKWIAANGHTTGPDLYECYLQGPGPETATELSRPLLAPTSR
jgi:effector-binding domain-containing protein